MNMAFRPYFQGIANYKALSITRHYQLLVTISSAADFLQDGLLDAGLLKTGMLENIITLEEIYPVRNISMSDYKNLVIKIVYWSGVSLLLRLAWISYVLIKLFPIATLLLISLIGVVFLY